MPEIIKSLKSVKDLKQVPRQRLNQLASEIREEIIKVTSKQGGHLSSNLGVVELTVALYYVLELDKDKVVWDVGHQCYPHKLLTGRYAEFSTIRQESGLSGFPKKTESKYDIITSGHSSTSISFALGLAAARDLGGSNEKVVAIVGDGALSGGEAFEGLNNTGQSARDITIILNSNEMSISESVGALSSYLTRILANPLYNRIRDDLREFVNRIPMVGPRVLGAARKFEEGLKNLLVPGIFFEELGFNYYGPIDGHNIDEMIDTFDKVTKLKGPKIIHVVTRKGKGYQPAEADPVDFHSAKPFNISSGKSDKHLVDKIKTQENISYTEVFGSEIVKLARQNKKLTAITAAMPYGTGLDKFAREFPDRFFDVGIAEQHALTFSAGLAEGGYIPMVAIYSTFLQRGYDQIFHDICLQGLPVKIFMDRAGLVGEDGPTHHGVFDIAYLRNLHNLVIMAPKDADELISMVHTAIDYPHPVAVRYPKSKAGIPQQKKPVLFKPGESEVISSGKDVCLIGYGSMVDEAQRAADLLRQDGIEAMVVNARFAKPLDEKIIEYAAQTHNRVVTVEEGVLAGGFGSAVSELIHQSRADSIKLRHLGLPDKFIEHGSRSKLLDKYGLSADKIYTFIKKEFFK